MIVVEKYGTADSSDVLADTDLASMPANGAVTVYAVSNNIATLLSISGPGTEQVVRRQQITHDSTGYVIRQSDDVSYVFGVTQGGRYNITIDVTGTTEWHVRVIYMDLSEL